MLSRDLFTPLRLAERWSENATDEQAWAGAAYTSLRPKDRSGESQDNLEIV